MNIMLAKDVEDFLAEKVREGVCGNASDLINDILRAIRDQQAVPFSVTPELEAWLLESAEEPAPSLTNKDFAEIRKRVESRLPHST
jgi:Arc/MetJ-type ribon-helix-helix transcriptional regulator